MDAIQIEKSGKLSAISYETRTQDATDKAPNLLFEPCTIGEEVTLRDIFLLIARHLDVFEKLLGNWCREYTLEALSDQDFVENDEEPLEYLELYHQIEVDEDTLYGMDRPDFHAIGKDATGEIIAYTLSFLPVYKIAHLPVKLGPVRLEDGTTHKTTYTLGKILHGILWELSFYGPPENRDAKGEELREIVKKNLG